MTALSITASATELHLICVGNGTANKIGAASAFASDNHGNSTTVEAYERQRVGFGDQVNVDIVEGAGRIRMPRIMLPAIHGGKDGWMELQDLKEGDSEITATAGVNFMNNPKIRIDRVTGLIIITGKAGHYSAQCRPYDPKTVEKVF